MYDETVIYYLAAVTVIFVMMCLQIAGKVVLVYYNVGNVSARAERTNDG